MCLKMSLNGVESFFKPQLNKNSNRGVPYEYRGLPVDVRLADPFELYNKAVSTPTDLGDIKRGKEITLLKLDELRKLKNDDISKAIAEGNVNHPFSFSSTGNSKKKTKKMTPRESTVGGFTTKELLRMAQAPHPARPITNEVGFPISSAEAEKRLKLNRNLEPVPPKSSRKRSPRQTFTLVNDTLVKQNQHSTEELTLDGDIPTPDAYKNLNSDTVEANAADGQEQPHSNEENENGDVANGNDIVDEDKEEKDALELISAEISGELVRSQEENEEAQETVSDTQNQNIAASPEKLRIRTMPAKPRYEDELPVRAGATTRSLEPEDNRRTTSDTRFDRSKESDTPHDFNNNGKKQELDEPERVNSEAVDPSGNSHPTSEEPKESAERTFVVSPREIACQAMASTVDELPGSLVSSPRKSAVTDRDPEILLRLIDRLTSECVLKSNELIEREYAVRERDSYVAKARVLTARAQKRTLKAEAESRDLKMHMELLHGEMEKMSKEAQARYANLQMKYATRSFAAARSEKMVEEYTNLIADKDKEIKELQAKADVVDDAMEEAKKMRVSNMMTITAKLAQNKMFENEREKHKKEVDDLQGALDKAREDIADLEKKLTTERGATAHAKTVLEKTVSEFEYEKKELKDEMEQMRVLSAESEARLAELEKASRIDERLERKVNKLEMELTQAAKDIEKHKDAYNKLLEKTKANRRAALTEKLASQHANSGGATTTSIAGNRFLSVLKAKQDDQDLEGSMD